MSTWNKTVHFLSAVCASVFVAQTGEEHKRFLPSPFHSQPSPIDDELVEGLFSSHFRRLPCCKLYEGTLLPLDNGDGTNFTELVKEAPVTRKALSQLQTMANNQLMQKKNDMTMTMTMQYV